MNARIIRAVLLKELRETLRDRRTLIIMIVVPALLYPALLILTEQLALFGQRELERGAVSVAVQDAPPELVAALAADDELEAVPWEAVSTEAVQSGRVDVALRFRAEGWSEEGSNRARLFYDASRERSLRGRSIVERRLAAIDDSLLALRLERQGLPAGYGRPLVVSDSSVATPQRMGGYALGRFLPLILILMTILGAFYPSIDLAAGEKERGTLETLLATPAPRDEIVIGKFVAAALVALAAATLNLLSMLLTFQTGVVQFVRTAGLQFDLPLSAVLVIFAGLILLAVLFSALFLGIAIRSHSFKEAQNALTPVYIASFLPAMLPMMPGVQFTPLLAMLPVGGVAFLFRELLTGDAEFVPSIVAVGSTIVYTMATLAFAARAFGREDVLFGGGRAEVGGGGWVERWRAWRARTSGLPTPGAALALVALVALLFFYAARPLQLALGERGILVSQWLLLALPAALFVALGRYDARRTLALRPPGARALGAALLVIAGGIPLGWLIGWLQTFVLPIPYEFLEALQQFVTAEGAGRLLWLLLLVALTPAICEELVFRGVLLQGLGQRLSMGGAVLVSALVFGTFHLSFETAIRFLPTAWLGALLAYVVWHTGSLYASMLMHLVNNAVVVLLVSTPALRERFADPTGQPPWLPVVLAPLLLYAGVRLLPKREAGADAEPVDLAGPGLPAETPAAR